MTIAMNYSMALEFMRHEYGRTMDYHGEEYLRSFEDIADILDGLDYNIEHRITALFMNILTDTDASRQDVMEYGSINVLEAVELLRKHGEDGKAGHLHDIKGNILAFPVKMAEHLYKLRNTEKLKMKQMESLVRETEDYYLECARGTIFFGLMSGELEKYRNETKCTKKSTSNKLYC